MIITVSPTGAIVTALACSWKNVGIARFCGVSIHHLAREFIDRQTVNLCILLITHSCASIANRILIIWSYRHCLILSPFFPFKISRPPCPFGQKSWTVWTFCVFIGEKLLLFSNWRILYWFCLLGYAYMFNFCQIRRRNYDILKAAKIYFAFFPS